VRGRDWDQQIEVMELPRAFRTTLGSIPADIPYLDVPHDYRARSLRALGAPSRPRVGLLWESGDWNLARNVPLRDLIPILQTPGFEFFSFQRGRGRDELAALDLPVPVRDLSGDSPDVTHFAADLLHMDLLITVDTMAAHLAGALGRIVWVLLPFEADWRWMLDRRDSPWYPTMRLFRQRTPGDWQLPVGQVVRELSTWKESTSPLSAVSL
jgi:ADP-heptose:LPS heptosyltransferase